jgi:superfamily II DNA or RNA helicase
MAIAAGARVCDIHNPGRVGTVTDSPPRSRPSGQQWQVLWADQSVSYEYEGALERVESLAFSDPYELIVKARYGRADDLRRNLTFVHLTGRLANLVYSMGITNTDFYPHQYRPLLTLLDSPTTGILIADEVGLGKTIEAGLIWTEFRARYDKRRLLVVCPAMLRHKWQDELEQRFGVTAAIVSAQELLEELKRPRHGGGRDSAWIISYQSARPPRRWQPRQTADAEARSATWQLADLFDAMADEPELVDMVIFDEAHYMRNREASAWRLGDLLRGVSEYKVMLSATPINLRNEDLFSVLTLLDPDHFSRPEDLTRMIESNRPLVKARDIALNLKSTALQFAEAIAEAKTDPLLAESAQLERITRQLPTEAQFAESRFRSEIADALERVSLLSHVLTRTRKRDIQTERVERRVQRESVRMSEPERALYEAVTTAIRRYASERGIGDGFLLAMPQRQVASSPAALLRLWRGNVADDEDHAESGNYDPDLVSPSDFDYKPLRSYLESVVPGQVRLADLERNDTKLHRLLEELGKLFNESPDEKVIVFTSFRATAQYLEERLRRCDMPAAIVWGNQDRPKHLVIEEFRRDPRLRVLVATEVAAEGVDLQFCRTVVNYDLPWNPTRVEQRIGRVDRLGQKSAHINVWNLFFEDTIDDRIVSRLLSRLRIFEEALGEAEAVVGQAVARLEYELLCRPRTRQEEEELIDKAALVLENVARQRQDLEQNAAHMMAHGQRVLERIAAAQDLSRFVTEEDLFLFVRDYLEQYWPGHEFTADPNQPMQVILRLPSDLAARFDTFIRDRGAVAQTRLALGAARRALFHNNITERARDGIEVIHQFHPLVGFIAEDLKARQEQFFPLVAVTLDSENVPFGFPQGDYVFYAMQWSFAGVQQEEWLSTAAVALADQTVLEKDQAETLLQLARLRGRDWLGVASDLATEPVARAMERAEGSLDSRYEDAKSQKQAENEDRARFQLDSIERHEQRRLISLASVEQRHRSLGREGLVKATQGQRRVLLEKMNVRRAAVRERAGVECTRRFVCAGLVRVQGGSR